MKLYSIKSPKFALLVALVVTPMLSSFTQASAFNLQRSCELLPSDLQEQTDSACYAYIQGFFDGAVLTDSRIMQGIDKRTQMSEFSQRVIRNRLGTQRGSTPDTYLAEFCLEEPRASQQDIFTVIGIVQNSKIEDLPPGELIYTAIRIHFPCPEGLYK